MLWAVLLFAVNEGLRIEEVLTLTYESFLSHYFDVQEGHIDSLLFNICRKTDVVPIHMISWEDHFTPEFLGIRVLLL